MRLGDIDQDTTVQNDLWGAVTVLFEDGMGVNLHVAKYDEHYSEILLWKQRRLQRCYSDSFENYSAASWESESLVVRPYYAYYFVMNRIHISCDANS